MLCIRLHQQTINSTFTPVFGEVLIFYFIHYLIIWYSIHTHVLYHTWNQKSEIETGQKCQSLQTNA